MQMRKKEPTNFKAGHLKSLRLKNTRKKECIKVNRVQGSDGIPLRGLIYTLWESQKERSKRKGQNYCLKK